MMLILTAAAQMEKGMVQVCGAGSARVYMNARYYAPTLNHFLSADTIVPDPASPQNYNRYSYVLNNPLRYVDPNGHEACLTDGMGGEACPGSLPEPMIETGGNPCEEWWSNSCDLEAIMNLEEPLILDFGYAYTVRMQLVIMPPGSEVAQGTQAPVREQLVWLMLGILLDEAEWLAIVFAPDLNIGEFTLAGIDLGVSVSGCFASGKCYIGQPHESLPTMLVFGQDTLVTAADLAVSWTVLLDLATTSASILYDSVSRGLPNIVSVGISPQGLLYILVYPDGGTEWDRDGWR